MKAPAQAGLSLVELLVVIMILGLAAMLAIPSFSASDHSKLDLAAEELAQAIRYARSLAMQQGAPFGFVTDAPGLRIRVFRADTGTNPWTPVFDVYHPLTKSLYDVDLANHPFAKVDNLNRSATFRGTCNAPTYVYFDTNGTPWCGDPESVLLEQGDMTFSLKGETRVVSVNGISGRVTIQ